MKAYLFSENSGPGKAEIVSAVKALNQECGREVYEDSDLCFGQLHAEDFFFEETETCVWGRIFLKGVSAGDFSKLVSDFQFLRKKKPFHKIQIKIYGPAYEPEALETLEGIEPSIFRYSFIQTRGERAMLIEKIVPKAMIPGRLSVNSTLPVQTEYNFSKHSQITRNELAELIDLSLDLKRL